MGVTVWVNGVVGDGEEAKVGALDHGHAVTADPLQTPPPQAAPASGKAARGVLPRGRRGSVSWPQRAARVRARL